MTEVTGAPLFFQLEVQAVEDLHTGSGTGSGDVDALVQRDHRGQPVIRASHFRGLLREAGEELIAFDGEVEENLNRLLGAPGTTRGALRMTSLHMAEGRETLVWGSTKRVDGGRAAEEDTLRFVEHVAAGTRFVARLRLPDSACQPLLERLLGRIDRLGGDRNRGSGLVKLHWEPRSTSSRELRTERNGTRLRLVLRNLEPLCLPATGHPGNLIRTHSFVRGQTLRGALMAWAIHNGHQDALPLFDRMSVGDALPLPDGVDCAHTVVPIPLSIQTPKPSATDAEVPWWADSPAAPAAFDSLGVKPQMDEKPKRPGAHEYLCRRERKGPWVRYTPTMSVRLRNATPDRGSREEATLFSVEEIAEDTRFQADLLFDDEASARDFLAAFTALLCAGDWLAVGRGGQPVVVESIAAVPEQSGAHFADDWILTLASDLIVRGEHLGFLDHLDLPRLCALAGAPEGEGWAIEQAVVESAPVHGFNAVTGLTRAPALALRRGSCWRIRGPGSAALAKALASKPALGERIGEGFGRFLIDVQPISEIGKPERGTDDHAVNRDEELLSLARELSARIKQAGPSLSQLQWLREQALAAQNDGDIDALLRKIEQAPSRRPQGGKAWSAFEPLRLRQEVGRLQNPSEKRRLLAYLVQWLVPAAKEKRR